jgi:hypothetical protein
LVTMYSILCRRYGKMPANSVTTRSGISSHHRWTGRSQQTHTELALCHLDVGICALRTPVRVDHRRAAWVATFPQVGRKMLLRRQARICMPGQLRGKHARSSTIARHPGAMADLIGCSVRLACATAGDVGPVHPSVSPPESAEGHPSRACRRQRP